MSTRSPEPTGSLVPVEGNAARRPRHHAAGRLGARLVTMDAERKMAAMERVLRAAGNPNGRVEALATLRRWELDPRLDSASREKANALLWRYEPNGWDEV